MNKPNIRFKEIQKRLVLALKYYRIAHRLTANEIMERTGVNFYLIESGERPVTIPTIVKLESVFGGKIVSELMNHTWHGEGEWTEDILEKKIAHEKQNWDKEKKSSKKKKG